MYPASGMLAPVSTLLSTQWASAYEAGSSWDPRNRPCGRTGAFDCRRIEREPHVLVAATPPRHHTVSLLSRSFLGAATIFYRRSSRDESEICGFSAHWVVETGTSAHKYAPKATKRLDNANFGVVETESRKRLLNVATREPHGDSLCGERHFDETCLAGDVAIADPGRVGGWIRDVLCPGLRPGHGMGA